METLQAIATRRSIRTYTDQPVPPEAIDALLKAAFAAPSALDERPWHFVVVTEPRILRRMAGKMGRCEMLETAMAGILVCGDPALEKIPGFWIQDCSASAQNVLLAAHARGLGAVWIAIDPVPDRIDAVRELLHVPEHIVPMALISLGCPAEVPAGADRDDTERVHRNTW